jgi:hypothetical protein
VGRKGLLLILYRYLYATQTSRKALLAPFPSGIVVAIELIQYTILVPVLLPDEFTEVLVPLLARNYQRRRDIVKLMYLTVAL